MSIELPPDTTVRLRTQGFLQLVAQDAVLEAVQATFTAAREFFAASEEEKHGCVLPLDCGYRPYGAEYSVTADIPDALESFTVSDRARIHGVAMSSTRGHELYARMDAAFGLMEVLSEALAHQIASDVSGGTAGALCAGAFRRWSRLQLNFARPTATSNDFINELHEDGHFLTIVKSTGSGLEVRTPQGNFISPAVEPHEVLVMPGQIVSLMTAGEIKPLYHRVRKMRGQAERMALLFFADIVPQYCVPWKHSEAYAGIDIGARVLTNSSRFGLRDFPIE